MAKLSALAIAIALVVTPNQVWAQSCRDVPGLIAQFKQATAKIKADAPAQRAMRQFGAICPAVVTAHRTLNAIVAIAERAPNRCGASPAKLAELQNWKGYLDIHSDCGRP
ncbi:MAG TPA: hypothetical protein VIL09_09465 [Microvirga sp.]|jgi:hypothetical protein